MLDELKKHKLKQYVVGIFFTNSKTLLLTGKSASEASHAECRTTLYPRPPREVMGLKCKTIFTIPNHQSL